MAARREKEPKEKRERASADAAARVAALGSGVASGKVENNHGVRLWTVGHSTRSAEDFIALLKAHGIRQLIDVRTVPRSRHNPQFNRDQLPASLAPAGIRYLHMATLGGLRRARPDSINTAWRNASFRGFADYMQTAEFAAAIEELIRLARSRPTAIMCAEAVPWRCHRSLIADALAARGVRVEEIASRTATRPHTLTPWARVDGERVTYPGDPAVPAASAIAAALEETEAEEGKKKKKSRSRAAGKRQTTGKAPAAGNPHAPGKARAARKRATRRAATPR